METTTLILFIIGFVLLIAGAELLVRGSSRLAIAMGISPLVVGLTIVAFGTSAPELAVTIQSTYAGQSDLAIGNVVGSNISNILLVLGLAAIFGPLIVAQQLVRLEIPLMIAASVVVLLMGIDGVLSRWDGLILFLGAATYTTFVIRQSRKETREVREEYEHEFDGEKTKLKGPAQTAGQVALVVVGLIMLVIGAGWLIDGAVVVAELLGVSELVIGLTIIAVGTSLPEIATSVVASIRKERDIAVGNAVGSNIFNILLVLGLTAMVAPMGIEVSRRALTFDIPVMIAVAVACLPIFFTNYRISRWEGFLFFGYYIAYTVYLFLLATNNYALRPFQTLMGIFVIPLTVITLLVIVVRHIQFKRQAVAVRTGPAIKERVPPSQN